MMVCVSHQKTILSCLPSGPVSNSKGNFDRLIDLAFTDQISDIVAELNLPMSGILTLEENMPAPNFMAALEFDRFDPIHIESYMTQLQLRKHLNQLHTMFYKPEESEGELRILFN